MDFLLVSSLLNDQVLRYDGTTGFFLDVFASGGGLNEPTDITLGPDGNLYVSSVETDQVLRYDGTTGFFLDVFASGGGL
ncbi:MAG: PEP-CTERM sorting domain-containing protein, partial [Hormoscilla sp.]